MSSITFKALIFDLGNVVIDIAPQRSCDYWASICDRNPLELYVAFPFDQIYARFERGEIAPEQFREHVCNCLGISISPADFDEGWKQILIQVRENIPELLKKLSSSYTIVALSNTNDIHVPMWREMCKPILPYFEKIFSSNEIHFRKPEPEAYQHVLDFLNAPPEQIVFLDDNYENILTAKDLGMQTVHVIDFFQMVKEFEKIGIM